VVGRRWGARGGGRQRAFYPSFSTEEIVELSPGVPVRITTTPRAPTLLSGAGSGRRDRELADLGALMMPGSTGLAVQFSLGADDRLYASICIDGECYQGSVDLSEVLGRIADGIASYHVASNPAPRAVAVEPGAEGTANAANAAVDAAGDLLVGALIDQHSATVSAGWWHSLTHAIYDVHHAMAKTVQKFKAPITITATAVATAYGGPAGGAAAAKFTGPIIDAVANDFHSSKGKGAKAVVDAAHAAAQSDPRVAKALADAHKAVADTAAAYHLTSTAAEAAGGDSEATRKLEDLDRAASSGDSAAQRAMSVITQAFSTAADNAAGDSPTTSGGWPLVPFALGAAAGMGGYAWWRHHHARKAKRAAAAIDHPPEPPPPGASPTATSGELIGAAISTLRSAAKAAAMAAYEHGGDTALGYVKDAHGTSVQSFPSLDDADDWFGALNPRQYLYAAYFDATDPTWPNPINEQLGGPAAASAHAHVSGALL
jgi:hypothetical protein